MAQFNIPEPFNIPFFDEDHTGGLWNTIKNSGKRRKMNPFYFLIRKIKNMLLSRMAYFCPLNSLRVKFHRWRGVNIGKDVYIGTQCTLDNAYPEMIFIEDSANINQGSVLLTHTNIRSCFKGIIECKVAPIYVKTNAIVSINSTILPGVVVGEYSIVSAASLVVKNVEPYTIVSGNPARKKVNLEKFIRKNVTN